jgi:hypothetical protein
MNVDDFANRFLEKGRERYEAGDKSAILDCLQYCLMSNPAPSIPAWLRKAFCDACAHVDARLVKSWDDVFGRPVPKGWSDRRLAQERRKAAVARDICVTVTDRNHAGEPIDDKLFASVGKKYGVGSTVAKEIYYGERVYWVSGKIKKKPETSGKI